LVILCDTGSHLKEKINKRGGWVGGWGNSSSKAFGISFADRPKAKNRPPKSGPKFTDFTTMYVVNFKDP
jgi:hypothetical protein